MTVRAIMPLIEFVYEFYYYVFWVLVPDQITDPRQNFFADPDSLNSIFTDQGPWIRIRNTAFIYGWESEIFC